MAMLNKRGATSNESIPVPRPAAIPSSEENGASAKRLHKHPMTVMDLVQGKAKIGIVVAALVRT
jgi:hypothetical protein